MDIKKEYKKSKIMFSELLKLNSPYSADAEKMIKIVEKLSEDETEITYDFSFGY